MDEKGFAFKTDMSPEMKEQIRQIVREEIAAHRGRPEVISLTEEKRKMITDYVNDNPMI